MAWDLIRAIFNLDPDEDSLLESIRHNRQLYRRGIANKHIGQYTTIGWRPDPHTESDGFTEVRGPTQSGNTEYRKRMRR